ncbi:Glycosyltransferase involved in cell wall bisynthesis [Parapedobacter luteus]|uniref:Glycosyltransferase involved in cell wall bisynthesis n=1 Tax=Parapedobacter luteus TaxID=623280 RepID=A0A1T5FQC0_9SPHI|nr:glycosyltransferase family 2 protein [Parapedobacter luteus]SKB98369.1 Glycosyltransferase involved in cell wall bisynthesis [Parapedobacter luteus]
MKNKHSALVSIIIPVYNSENYIVDTIHSCLNQSHKNIEIIVVNDGSTDSSEKKILEIQSQKIKYHKVENNGPCAARNFGIQQAKGDLVQFLDHDDILHPDKLERQLERYAEFGDLYIYSAKMGTANAQTLTIDPDYELYQNDFTIERYFETVLNQFGKYITTGAWLVPAELIKLTHGWDENAGLNDDGEYFARLILNSKGIIYCDNAVFYFRRNVPNSLSKRFDSKDVYEKWLHSYILYAKHFHEKLDPTTAKELSWKALSRYYCASYPNYPDLLEKCKQLINELGYKHPYAHGGSKFYTTSKVVGVYNALKIWNLKNTAKRTLNKLLR